MKYLITILFLFVFVIAYSTDYYVATSANGGNDGNDGSAGSPWLTISKACVSVTTSGDVINVGVGTFPISSRATLALGVSITGQGENSVISSTVTGTWVETLKLGTESGSSVVNGNQSISYLKFDGNNETAFQAIEVYNLSNVQIHHCTVENFSHMGIVLGATNSNVDTEPNNYCTGNSVYDCTISNSSIYDGSGYGGLRVGCQVNMWIYNNNISQSGRAAGTNGYPLTLKQNGGWMHGCKIFDNVIYYNDASSYDFAIEVYKYVFGLEVWGNELTGTIDLNITAKGAYTYGAYIHDNTISAPDPIVNRWIGITLEFATNDVIITRNRIVNCMYGVTFAARTGDLYQNIDITYNVFENIQQSPTSPSYQIGCLYADDMAGGYVIDNLNFSNNTITSTGTTNTYGIVLNDATSATDVTIRNNILTGFTNAWFRVDNGEDFDGLYLQNNITYNSAALSITGTPSNYVNSDNSTENPLFVSSSDLSLQEGSPAIDAGLDVGQTTDFLENPIIGIPDIGAYEFQGDEPPPIPPTPPSPKGIIVLDNGKVLIENNKVIKN